MRDHVLVAASVPLKALESRIGARHREVRAGLQTCGVENVDVEAQQFVELPESRGL